MWLRGPVDGRKELPKLSEREFSVRSVWNCLISGAGELRSIWANSGEHEKYSDLNEVFDLPFPSVNEIPPRFSLLDEGRFSYMGREWFKRVFEAFSLVQSNSLQRQAVYIYGSKVFGKSYIFAALACVLVRKGIQVVYIPDCRACLLDLLSYLLTAFAFAFVKSETSFREEILDCENFESFANFCRRTRRGTKCGQRIASPATEPYVREVYSDYECSSKS